MPSWLYIVHLYMSSWWCYFVFPEGYQKLNWKLFTKKHRERLQEINSTCSTMETSARIEQGKNANYFLLYVPYVKVERLSFPFVKTYFMHHCFICRPLIFTLCLRMQELSPGPWQLWQRRSTPFCFRNFIVAKLAHRSRYCSFWHFVIKRQFKENWITSKDRIK